MGNYIGWGKGSNKDHSEDNGQCQINAVIQKEKTSPSIRFSFLKEMPDGTVDEDDVLDVEVHFGTTVLAVRQKVAKILNEEVEVISFFYRYEKLNDEDILSDVYEAPDFVIHIRNERLDYGVHNNLDYVTGD